MYDIRQFKPVFYALLLVGVVGFAVASGSGGAFALATGGVVLHLWLVRTGRFRPIPRWFANGLTLAGAVYVALAVRDSDGPPILLFGKFLLFMQLVKLYEQRANRDVAQLIVLSLLLMVAAAISTSSLWFGLLFIGYLFLSLYCCLLFHLKVETDAAKRVMGLLDPGDPDPDGGAIRVEPNPATLRQDQRRLGSSMRRLTLLVSTFAISMAVLVFLFFPRGAGAGMLAPLPFRPGQTLTGFQDKVSFQSIARITQNRAEVAKVEVRLKKPGEGELGPPADAGVLLLRGVTLDKYDEDADSPTRWQWTRSNRKNEPLRIANTDRASRIRRVTVADAVTRQTVTLLPTGTRTLFALPGPVRVGPSDRELQFHYEPTDGTLRADEFLRRPVKYVVDSDGALPATAADLLPTPRPATRPAGDKILDYALRPDVSGTGPTGQSLGRRRLDATGGPTDLDLTIAQNIANHLQRTFAYTLDLTDAGQTNGRDPLEAFLYDFKRGHCEYFAGSMALMCQKLGIDARVVVGFKCDEYNAFGGFYQVRQSHAHAWVEVLGPAGWRTFDPTSGRDAESVADRTNWQKFKHLLNFLEFKWGENVVAYDTEARGNLVNQLEAAMGDSANSTGAAAKGWQARASAWLERGGYYAFGSAVLVGLVGLAVLAMCVAVCWFAFERLRLRRRAKRIGLEHLPEADQKRLARQLGFYDDLLRLLERHGIARPANLTPLEFSRSVDYLPPDVYRAVGGLTGVFYKIRYGGRELSATRRRWLDNVIERLTRTLDGA